MFSQSASGKLACGVRGESDFSLRDDDLCFASDDLFGSKGTQYLSNSLNRISLSLSQEVQSFAVKLTEDHSSFSKSAIRFILFKQTKSH